MCFLFTILAVISSLISSGIPSLRKTITAFSVDYKRLEKFVTEELLISGIAFLYSINSNKKKYSAVTANGDRNKTIESKTESYPLIYSPKHTSIKRKMKGLLYVK